MMNDKRLFFYLHFAYDNPIAFLRRWIYHIFVKGKYGLPPFIIVFLFVKILSAMVSCAGNVSEENTTVALEPRTDLYVIMKDFRYALKPIEVELIEQGLVNVHDLDSTLVVDLKYAGTDNFMGQNVYEGMRYAYLQEAVARQLVKSQQYLKEIKPGYSLVIFDAARPRRIQQKMWDALEVSAMEKTKFLSNPARGSVHNFGAAVDVGLVDEKGDLLDMGTPFDYFGEKAHPALEQEMLLAGKLQTAHVENRKLLRRVMWHGGFWGIQTEWWHFNAMTRQQAKEKYKIIE